MDPFENFAEQQSSYEMLEEHRAALAADAAELLREHPALELVGLIMEAEASEAVAFREAFERATGQSFTGKGFLGVVPRELVLRILRANAPATLDWLPPSREGPPRTIPLVAVTRRGFRFGAVSCPTTA